MTLSKIRTDVKVRTTLYF